MRIRLLAAVIVATFLRPALADEWVVEAPYAGRADLARAAKHFQHLEVDRERAVFRVQANDRAIARLEAAGYAVRVDMEATARLRNAFARMASARLARLSGEAPQGGPYDTIDGYSCYRTVEGTYDTMDDLAADHPGIVEIHEIGPSWRKEQGLGGYEMRALRITNLATAVDDPDRPAMVVFGSIHAREYAPAEITTRFAEWLVQGYGTDPEATWLVDHNDFRLVLQANPDGRKIAEGQDYWRKNVNDVDGFCSWGDDGVDLNRNFPFHWHITGDGWDAGSSGDPCDETFRGPLAQSEPETDNLVTYVAGTCNAAGECSGGVFADRRTGTTAPPGLPDDGGAAPDDTTGVFFDIHSYAELVLWSWGDTASPAPNRDGLRRLGRRLAAYNQYYPQQADELYPTDGTTDDTIYGLLGVPAYTFETDGEFFQSCSGPQGFEALTLQKNLDALRYAARTLRAPYRLPGGPDVRDIVVTGVTEGATGWIASLQATIDDTRYSTDNGTETTFAISGARAWIDGLPWQPATDATALAASDGAFDEKTEQVEGTLDLKGIAPGRHLLYVQGINVRGGGAGTVGTPNAVFIDVPEFDDTIFDNGFDGETP